VLKGSERGRKSSRGAPSHHRPKKKQNYTKGDGKIDVSTVLRDGGEPPIDRKAKETTQEGKENRLRSPRQSRESSTLERTHPSGNTGNDREKQEVKRAGATGLAERA